MHQQHSHNHADTSTTHDCSLHTDTDAASAVEDDAAAERRHFLVILDAFAYYRVHSQLWLIRLQGQYEKLDKQWQVACCSF